LNNKIIRMQEKTPLWIKIVSVVIVILMLTYVVAEIINGNGYA
jgi:hypothetical protein